MADEHDGRYVEILLEAIRVCAQYKPKMGRGVKAGFNLADFQTLYRNDPFYTWLGLDHPLMYAAHKAAGGMTSIYRQIGIGCERLFRQIIQDHLDLTVEEVQWSYIVKGPGKKTRKQSLDGRIPFESVRDPAKLKRVATWVAEIATNLGVIPDVVKVLRGVVFEVRQGYKSKDSKRQNADIANAAYAYSEGYLPCVALFSTQMDSDIFARYESVRWAILTGRLEGATVRNSTYAFSKKILGYDLASFFERNAPTFGAEVSNVLESLLRTE